ncbi:hypothetical protein PF002_g24843 [Phytophthora fragariae]|uniref:Uncharacterized protein n=1 Tax=Phytophthora fragariae TaxID=53985 RepID=A0A6A3QKF8_9STRA|nr:hypothetical protein PF003_g6581 [Phytophthora fragariae]KAE8925143.1 hypothetical protein PF009_g24640 [Phytophthora fragariae]KAE9078372.1 hypothetical protein PF007_g23885 [Phytophthora fragariae]KAE9187849.1 hypothetical protein PF004_g22676 [Phytophthora fragariae]KAE9190148.1 hypothetical protein PF002_g24843 [Phytophthora fragariae]
MKAFIFFTFAAPPMSMMGGGLTGIRGLVPRPGLTNLDRLGPCSTSFSVPVTVPLGPQSHIGDTPSIYTKPK